MSRRCSKPISPPNTARAPCTEEAATHCESVGDRVSKNLFEDLMKDEEGHIDFLETQLQLVKQIGLELYAQRHIGDISDDD